MINATHQQLETIACRAGWDSYTLLLLIARWTDDNDQSGRLLRYLAELADAEDESDEFD